jgi:hypothetical protein
MSYPSLILGEINEQQQSHKLQLINALKKYLPPQAVEYCSELIMHHKLHLHIEVERKGRLGDYSPHLGKGNRISINHNLNPYDFLVTFVHELAHHTTYKKYGSKHEPHGAEWKDEFKIAMRPFVMMKIFPDDILQPLIKHMKSPKYTHSGDVGLMKALMHYDKNKSYITLDELATGTIFKMTERSRVIMQKGEKRRTYFMCEAIETKKKYLVHAIAKVILVS